MSESRFTPENMKSWANDYIGLPVGASTEGRLSVTGEPYLIMCPTGEWGEGASCPSWHPTEDAAWSTYLDTIRAYAKSVPGGVLYWRTPPEITKRKLLEKTPWLSDGEWHEVTLYTVYSRLLVSNKRVLEAA